ncbi:MAG: pre-peptidase C-terminal domain-containing protein [Armatimonadota bacterium]
MRPQLRVVYCAIAALAVSVLLSACGGGGSPRTVSPATSPTVNTANALGLTLGAAPVAGALLQGQTSLYTATLQSAHTYVVTLQSVAADEDSDLYVFRPVAAGRTLIGSSRLGHTSSTTAKADWVGFVSQNAGAHPLEVRAFAPTTATHPDRFRIEAIEATQLAPGASASATVAATANQWRWFSANNGTQYRVTLTPSSGNPNLYVYGATSSLLRGSSTHTSGADVVTFTANASGRHYVRVYGGSASSYSLKVAQVANYDNLFFLHHSTGAGLIAGGMRATVASYNSAHGTHFAFWDHGYNGDGLTNPAGAGTGICYDIPNDNTDPVGLNYLWVSHNADAVACRDRILSHHQVIAFKSCFPASAIPDAATLSQYKTWYLQIRSFLDTRPDRLFVVMSTPPLHRLATDTTSARNARAFANWLKSSTYLSGHPNLVCFDLFDKLAKANDGSATANRLKYEYEGSHTGDDSHPNTTANAIVGPQFATFLCEQAAAYASR